MHSWAKQNLGGRRGNEMSDLDKPEKELQQQPELRQARLRPERGRCKQCFDLEPHQWFAPPKIGDPPTRTVFSWSTDECSASCEIGALIRKSSAGAVSFQSWLSGAIHSQTRPEWVEQNSTPCFSGDCILCRTNLVPQLLQWSQIGGLYDARLVDSLHELTTVETFILQDQQIQVDLGRLRRLHAPQWLKTVGITAVNHGTWSSVSLRYSTSTTFYSNPLQPGCQPTKHQRTLIAVHNGSSAPSQGRRLNRRYDPEIIKLWHRTCSEAHSARCHPETDDNTPYPIELKLIDVKDWCIRTLPPEDRPDYVALSYVWGVGGQPTLSEETLEPWFIVDAMQQIDLPQTIKDAARVVQEIGMRFLWVDSLCIVHDDKEQEALHIGQMDRIYSRATLVLAAAATEGDCHAGLPGVSRPWQFTHQPSTNEDDGIADAVDSEALTPSVVSLNPRQLSECKVGSMSLMEVLEDPEASLKDSVWRQRGWTFQEELCSSRIVYFLDSNLLFKCGDATWRADVALETAPSVTMSEYHDDYHQRIRGLIRQPDSMDRRQLVDLFRKLVHGYTLRARTRDDDIEKAFAGVANALRESIGPAYHGIPERIFGEIVEGCWYWDLLLQRRDGLPSWSWTGWIRTRAPGAAHIKDPEIGITPVRAQMGGPLHRFFRFASDSPPKPLFAADSVTETGSDTLLDHFRPDMDEINQRHQEIIAQPQSLMNDYIAFFTSLGYLSVRSRSRFWQEEENYSVHHPEALNKTLTTIRLRSDKDRSLERRTQPFIVTSKSEKGFQLMMLEFVDGIAYKMNATAPSAPVKEEDWVKVGAERTLVVMG